LAYTLLASCPRLHLLATSREALRVPGEVPWRVPSLPLPDPRHLPRDGAEAVATLGRSDAVRLFVERARQHQPDFALTPANAGPVAEICRRLAGLPLALDLAAARVPLLPVEQLAARLDDALTLLTAGSRTALPRQRTLRATLDWSHALLDEAECTLLRRVAV